jgi:diketogulonate reductase-like aldo/keto reductase
MLLLYFLFSSIFIPEINGQAEAMSEYISLTVSAHGLRIPRLGLGTAGLGSKTAFVTQTALDAGIRLIDTAQAPEWYSEEKVGDGLRNFLVGRTPESDPVTVITKIHPRSFQRVRMEKSISDSKHALYGSTDSTLDIVLLHTPHCWAGHCTPEEESVTWHEAWRNLESLMSAGGISAVGVSNFDKNLLTELVHMSKVKVSVVQNWMDPFHQDTGVRQYAAEQNIVYMAYSSFGTQWQGKQDGNPVFSNTVLLEIARKHDTTVSDVVISWLLQEEVVAIPRASSKDHIIANSSPISTGLREENLRVFLDKDDMEEIRSLDGTLGHPWN